MAWIGPAIAAGGALLSSGSASDAASAAADAQRKASDAAIAEQKRQFDLTRQDQMPWLNSGSSAVSKLADLLGLNVQTSAGTAGTPATAGYWTGDGSNLVSGNNFNNTHVSGGFNGVGSGRRWVPGTAAVAATDPTYAAHSNQFGSLLKPFSMSDYQADPGYQFRLEQGQKANEANLRARGLWDSGGALKELDAYNSGLASQEYGNAYNRYNNDQTNIFNRLSGVAGTGQQSAQNLGSQGANYANSLSNLYTGQGNADAAMNIAQGNARSSAYTGAGGAIGQYFNNQSYSAPNNLSALLAQQTPYSGGSNYGYLTT